MWNGNNVLLLILCINVCNIIIINKIVMKIILILM